MENERLGRLKAMLAEDPEDVFLKYAMAMELRNQNDLEGAIHYLESVYANDPSYLALYFHLGKLYESVQQPEKAMRIYEEGIQRSSEAQDLHTMAEIRNAKMNLELNL